MGNESKNSRTIVYFDGVCGFCNARIDFLLRHDQQRKLRFSPLQGETAAKYLPPELREDLETLVVTEGGKTFVRSEAALRAMKQLGGVWGCLAGAGLIVPRVIRDGVYQVIARNRYRWFGKLPQCRLPTSEEQPQFLP